MPLEFKRDLDDTLLFSSIEIVLLVYNLTNTLYLTVLRIILETLTQVIIVL